MFREQIAPKIKRISTGSTIYAAANELALDLSIAIHGNYQRLGYMRDGKIAILDDVAAFP